MDKQTNINNNTYNIDNKHNNDKINKSTTFKVSPRELTCESELLLRTEASPLLLAGTERESGSLSVELPEFTKFIKVDLFDSSKHVMKHRFKVSVAICRRDVNGRDRTLQFRAAMNSPKRYVRRGVEDIWRSDPHYQRVQRRMVELDAEGVVYAVSKCYEYTGRQKGRTVRSITVFLVGVDQVEILWGTLWIPVKVRREGLTTAQRRSDIIGTALIVPGQADRIDDPDTLWGY